MNHYTTERGPVSRSELYERREFRAMIRRGAEISALLTIGIIIGGFVA